MKPTPSDWPRLSSSLFYKDAGTMLDGLCDTLEFELRLKVEGDDGQIVHSAIPYSESVEVEWAEHGAGCEVQRQPA